MSGTFTSAAIQIPVFVIPPPGANGSTIVFSPGQGVSLSSNEASSGLTWSSANGTITLSISSSFVGAGLASATYTPTGGTGVSIPFGVLSSGSQSSTTTSVTVSATGSLTTTPPSGVTYEPAVSLIQSIPPGGQVEVSDPLFFVPTGASSSNPFTFSLSAGTGVTSFNSPTLTGTLTSPNNNQINVGSPALSTAVINFNTAAGTGSATIAVLPSVNSASTGAATNLTVNSDGSIVVTGLATGVKFTCFAPEYQTTTAGNYVLNFTAVGLNLSSNPITFSGGTPTWITNLLQGTGSASFSDTNTQGTTNSANFSIATGDGTIDPTIVNNPS